MDDDFNHDDFPQPSEEDSEDYRRETIAADPEALDEIARAARETVIADELDVDDHGEHARETIVAEVTELGIPPDDTFRADFDERLGKVRARRARFRQQGGQPRRRRRLITPGCVALVLASGLIGLAVIVLASFLPPFAEANPIIESLEDSSGGHVELDSQDTTTERDGLSLEVLPSDPGQNLSVAIESASPAEYLANDVPASLWNCQPADSLPRTGELAASVYSLDFTGTLPQRIGFSMILPEAVNRDLLNLYAWYPNTERWQFVPSQKTPDFTRLVTDLPAAPECLAVMQVKPPIPVVSASLDLGQSVSPDVASTINRLYVTGMHPTMQGTLQGLLPGTLPENPEFSVLPLISNATGPDVVDVETVRVILSNPESRLAHSANIASFAEAGNYAGVVIDYREVPPELRNQFSDFIQNLARALAGQNRQLAVMVPPAELTDTGWTGGAYDWRTLGLFAEEIVIRAPQNPQAFAPDGEVHNMLRWAVGEVDRYKLVLGLSALSLEVSPDGSASRVPADVAWTAISGIRVDEDAGELHLRLNSPYDASLSVDAGSRTPYVRYGSGDTTLRTFWLTTDSALFHRMQMTSDLNLGGVLLLDAQAEGISPGVPALLRAYQDGVIPPEQTLAVRWRVYDATGALISEEIAAPDASIAYPLAGNETNLRFEAALIGDIERELGVVEHLVGMAAAPAVEAAPVEPPAEAPAEQAAPETTTDIAQAATPTVIPSATPMPEPTAIPTAVPTINAPEVQGLLPATFEIGAHITGDYQDEKFDWMRVAGMNWVKIQLRFEPGMNADDYGWQIQLLHENGFKVLWGVVGEKDEVLNPGYFEEYAEFVARLAEIGANGIEVWNEMNLDREWPTGRIDPALYTQFLQVVYTEVKARNSDTLVISGALAPTGAEGAFGLDAVWNDDRYYQGLADAGAAQYMDCVGAHYNEGIVSPTQTDGDPRDNPYPTRYLTLQTARAANPFNGAIPVCYTELGYLTPEGFAGPLPTGFEWAQNVTVAQQASWLGGAALINAESGNVRLMIIWNLDFSEFEVDPAGGYAIIRPDGGCPACDTLGSLRPVTIIGGQ